MSRWIAVLAALLLAGCAGTRGYYYDGGHYSRAGHAYDYRGVGGSHYHGAYAGHGDYWYAQPSYRHPGYFESPYYYSLFWPINRWSYDPFWYPGYYYGVTWFPRNYFSFSAGWSHRWGPSWGHLAYSPYRYGWHDWYYDWTPWYRAYPNYAGYYGRPRFGDARNEAERLAGLPRASRYTKYDGGRADRGVAGGQGLPYAGRGEPLRAAPPRGLPSRGLPAAVDRGAMPRAGTAAPRSEGRALPRSAPRATLQRGTLEQHGAARGNRGRIEAEYSRMQEQRRVLPQRQYAQPLRPVEPALRGDGARYRGEAQPLRAYEAPARGYPVPREAGWARGYDAPARGYAPAPQYGGRALPQRGGFDPGSPSAPVLASPPTRSAAPAPRVMERSAPVQSVRERSARGRGSDEP